MVRSVFLNDYIPIGQKEFRKELNFWLGDLSNIDVVTDFRFKQVIREKIIVICNKESIAYKEVRKQAIFLGLVTGDIFKDGRVKYPFVLDNGLVINQDDYFIRTSSMNDLEE